MTVCAPPAFLASQGDGAYRTTVTGESVAAGRFVEIDPPKRLRLPSPEAGAEHGEGWRHYVERLAVRAEGGDPGPNAWL